MLVSNKVLAQTLSQFSETFKADHEVLNGELPVFKDRSYLSKIPGSNSDALDVSLVCQLHSGVLPILRLLSTVDQ